MRATTRYAFGIVGAAALLSLPACRPRCESQPAAEPPHATVPPVTVIDAVVIVHDCAKLGSGNAKLAEKAMNQLVAGCSELPSASANFSATLLPGGQIQIAAPSAQA